MNFCSGKPKGAHSLNLHEPHEGPIVRRETLRSLGEAVDSANAKTTTTSPAPTVIFGENQPTFVGDHEAIKFAPVVTRQVSR